MVKFVMHRRRARIFIRPMCRLAVATGTLARSEQPTDRGRSSSGPPAQSQIGYPQQIVGSRHKISPSLCPFHTTIAGPPQPADRFHPAKDFLHPFANALTGHGNLAWSVVRPSSPATCTPSLHADVRRDFPFPAPRHKFLLMIAFVRAQRLMLASVQVPMFVHLGKATTAHLGRWDYAR